jgi:hypothetical protein
VYNTNEKVNTYSKIEQSNAQTNTLPKQRMDPNGPKDTDGCLSLQERVSNLETIVVCDGRLPNASSCLRREGKGDDIEWSPFQAAVPASILASECNAARLIQKAWRRFSKINAKIGLQTDKASSSPQSVIRAATYDPSVGAELDRLLDGLTTETAVASCLAEDGDLFKLRVEVSSTEPAGTQSMPDTIEPMLTNAASLGMSMGSDTIRCETCAQVQPEECHWAASFTKLVTYCSGSPKVTHYCRPCGMPPFCLLFSIF